MEGVARHSIEVRTYYISRAVHPLGVPVVGRPLVVRLFGWVGVWLASRPGGHTEEDSSGTPNSGVLSLLSWRAVISFSLSFSSCVDIAIDLTRKQ